MLANEGIKQKRVMRQGPARDNPVKAPYVDLTAAIMQQAINDIKEFITTAEETTPDKLVNNTKIQYLENFWTAKNYFLKERDLFQEHCMILSLEPNAVIRKIKPMIQKARGHYSNWIKTVTHVNFERNT